jgi:hypothetical protein
MKNTHEDRQRDPDSLYPLFLASMADEPSPPPVAEQVRAATRGLQRRRGRTALLAAAVMGAAVLVPQLFDGKSEPDQSPIDVLNGLTPEALIAKCREGNQSTRATNALFQSGTPEVRVSGTVAEMMSVVLLSADGQYWANCFINLYDGAEFSSGMTVYPASGNNAGNGISYSEGFTCKDLDGPPGPPCSTFMVNYVDRVATEVAAVSFGTADGRTTTIEAEDGFVVFTYSGVVPAGYPTTYSITDRPPQWLTRVTYLDDQGEAIAAENFGRGRLENEKVGDLPRLDAYPSRRSEPIY